MTNPPFLWKTASVDTSSLPSSACQSLINSGGKSLRCNRKWAMQLFRYISTGGFPMCSWNADSAALVVFHHPRTYPATIRNGENSTNRKQGKGGENSF